MSIPDELDERMQLFRERGVATHRRSELFIETNWLAVYLGQGIVPQAFDPRAECMSDEEIRNRMQLMREYLQGAAKALPTHAESIDEYCAAPEAA